jgi:hypothetical protein
MFLGGNLAEQDFVCRGITKYAQDLMGAIL